MIDTIPMIEVGKLRKYFQTQVSPFKHKPLRAVDGVSFDVREDTVFSIVGESGCGKSTVARLMLNLMEPTSGTIHFRGKDVFGLKGDSLKAFRKSVQIVFQDPFSSLNPRRTIFETVSEPLVIHRLCDKSQMKDMVRELLNTVGLQDVLNNYPHEFSGGQRQRICIARALAVSPEIIVADEPLSALDVSVQSQILNLLIELKKQRRISFVFISHDLRVVEYFSDNVGVMYLGKIVEMSDVAGIFASPMHPYTEILLSSVPSISGARKRQVFKGEVPSPLNVPAGCPFHPRCPKRFEPCDNAVPELKEYKTGRFVSCHLWNK